MSKILEKIGGRKIMIYGGSLIVAIIVSLFMDDKKFPEFLQFELLLALGFFTGNSIEHIADSLKRKR